MSYRTQAPKSAARAVYHRALDARAQLLSKRLAGLDFDSVPDAVAVRLIYQVLLGRDPDSGGFSNNLHRLSSGALDRHELAALMRGSEEFQNLGFTAGTLSASIHAGRCQFIRSLPAGRRLVDLGGTHLDSDDGALVALGYPYSFDELVIVDLPSEARHEIYRSSDERRTVSSPKGPVSYRYHSMTDLSGFGDNSIDLVYSGQSIEHVTPDEGRSVLEQVHRILRPGGYLALDTPNGRVTRMQQADFVDPDHEVEYEWPQLRELLEHSGFTITAAVGLGYGGPATAQGRFDPGQIALHSGMHSEIEDCYILAVVARK